MSRDVSVKYLIAAWTTRIRFPTRAAIFSSSHLVQSYTEANSAAYPVGIAEVKRQKLEAELSPS
jgi:hypothetical protein